MLTSLYTVRVVLNTLGVEDYGIYNVVAGVVAMFGFLSGTMASASQRYFAFEIGREDFEQLKKVFSLSLTIYIFLGIFVLILAETIGLWFVNNKLVVPDTRVDMAQWIYQFSILSFLLTMITTPYMASIIAHEDMNIYAYVSIIEAVLKLGVVFLLRFIPLDKLQLYAILQCAVIFINTAIYRIICTIKYEECRIGFYWNKKLFKEITSYTGWNLFGEITTVCRNQAVTILLNQFFNPIVISARSIALSVNTAVSSFSNNFSNALQPQIVKTYSAEKKSEMSYLIYQGAKGTYFLMYIFALPLVLEMQTILNLWLKNPPEYAVIFTRLTLIDVLINSISTPIMAAARATGEIKLYQLVLGCLQIFCFIFIWMILLMGYPPYSVMIVSICITVIMLVIRLLIVRKLINLSIAEFFQKTILPASIVTVLSAILPIVMYIGLKQSIARLCIVIGVSLVSVCGCVYLFGLNKIDRKRIWMMITTNFMKNKLL
jgi:O-antigen/teichoic acid export membrane protein